jgi:PAS domain S-box-containing protein
MSFSPAQILLFIVAYLSGLFAVAHLADRGTISARVTRHPATYVLSLGVFAGAMASNGVIELAYRHGQSFLLYYAGVVLMFVFAALLLLPLLRLCRVYQLASLADVLTFRFRSPLVGASATLAMCVTMLPLLALQIHAVADSIQILGGEGRGALPGEHRRDWLAPLFCLIITAFSILFGTRHVSSQHRNTGLVTAIAFESLVKLAALTILMGAALFGVFDGPGEVQQWLAEHPGAIWPGDASDGEIARALLLVFFAGAVCMPHIFHMAFAENTDSRDLRSASWGVPLYLMLLSLPVLPVTWAGVRLEHGLPMEYSGLAIGLALHSPAVSGAAFVAGLSAASATIIVGTLALANMCLNHLVLPSRLLSIDREQSIYTQLRWVRRVLIALVILAGYFFYTALGSNHNLTQLALVAFTGAAQFLPGIIGTLYWTGANRKGLLAGLAGGLGLWSASLLLPVTGAYQIPGSVLSGEGDAFWAAATVLSLAFNAGLFILVSLLGETSDEERVAAEICCMDDLPRPARRALALGSAGEFGNHLAAALGEQTARTEVERALRELQFSAGETRPYALRRLRMRIEANLSGLLGPAVAHRIIERCIPFQSGPDGATDDINLIERNLERVRFTGLAADIDNLRRHYREILDKLPVGVCSLGVDGEILKWNLSMQRITGIAAGEVLGSLLHSLPHPWREIIAAFRQGESDTLLKTKVQTRPGDPRWITLHKTSRGTAGSGDTVILVEDITDFELLEEEVLHSERLASIGRLAAGVAHEIGNPITGIACLAQNLEYETDPGGIRQTAREILKQTGRVSRILESLVNFSHSGASAGELKAGPVNLADCVDEAIQLLALDRGARPVRFTNHSDRQLLVLAESQRLLQVFVNLLSNARDACSGDGHVQVCSRPEGEWVRIDVEDNGCGIPEELQGRVFEPFYTTKDPGAGTGLGLAMVFSILEELGGSVQITSPVSDAPNPGTCVTLRLPLGSYGAMFEV